MLRISHLHITIIAWLFVGRPVTEKKERPFKFRLHLGPPNLLLTTWSRKRRTEVSGSIVRFFHGGVDVRISLKGSPQWSAKSQRQKDRPNNPSELRLSLVWTEKSLGVMCCATLSKALASNNSLLTFSLLDPEAKPLVTPKSPKIIPSKRFFPWPSARIC